jgi:hypothetical protein
MLGTDEVQAARWESRRRPQHRRPRPRRAVAPASLANAPASPIVSAAPAPRRGGSQGQVSGAKRFRHPTSRTRLSSAAMATPQFKLPEQYNISQMPEVTIEVGEHTLRPSRPS